MVHDNFSYGFQISRHIANSVGIKEKIISERAVAKKEVLECEQLRVEADSWFSLGKCLLNAFSKLYSLPGGFKAYIQWPRVSRLHKCQNPSHQERKTTILQLNYCATKYVPSSQTLIKDAPSADEVEDITPIVESKVTKRRRSTAEVEEGDSKRRSLP